MSEFQLHMLSASLTGVDESASTLAPGMFKQVLTITYAQCLTDRCGGQICGYSGTNQAEGQEQKGHKGEFGRVTQKQYNFSPTNRGGEIS